MLIRTSRSAIFNNLIVRNLCSCAMSTKRAIVFLASGAEEMEAVIAIDVLRRGGIQVTVAGLTDEKTITCSRGVIIKPDVQVTSIKGDYDVLVLPGGLGGSEALAKSPEVGALLKNQESAGRLVAAICAAPTALLSHGVFLGRTITSYPSMEDKLKDAYKYQQDNVVVDGNLITSRGPGTAFDFSLTILEHLVSKDKAAEVAKGMLLTYK